MTKVNKLLGVALLFPLPLMSWAQPGESHQAAKDEGVRLYNIHKRATAIPFLEETAEAGDVEAMYYLGEAHRLRHMGMTREALDWYHLAAQGGDPYAMLRLESGNVCKLAEVCPDGGDNWAEAALAITLPEAESGDSEAMGTLFHVYIALGERAEAIDWLRKASEHGDPISQNLLGGFIRDDEAYIDDEAERLEVAEGWVRRAAEQDFIPAMATLSGILKRREKLEESWEWMVKASEEGYLDSRLGVGWCYLEPDKDERCRVQQDVVKGWAILTAMEEEAGTRAARNIMNRNRDLITEEQLEEAEALAQEWLDKGPPLSEYPPRYGF